MLVEETIEDDDLGIRGFLPQLMVDADGIGLDPPEGMHYTVIHVEVRRLQLANAPFFEARLGGCGTGEP